MRIAAGSIEASIPTADRRHRLLKIKYDEGVGEVAADFIMASNVIMSCRHLLPLRHGGDARRDGSTAD